MTPIVRRAKRGAGLKFVKDAVKSDTNDCIIWPYGSGKDRYPVVSYKGRVIGAHRLSLILSEGDPPEDKNHAAHDPINCTTRLCVNPRHLRWASQAENNFDGAIRRRSERKALLSYEQVNEIREKYKSYGEIAELYEVNYGVIRDCLDRKSWRKI